MPDSTIVGDGNLDRVKNSSIIAGSGLISASAYLIRDSTGRRPILLLDVNEALSLTEISTTPVISTAAEWAKNTTIEATVKIVEGDEKL